jgi:hypothetical protein
MNAQRFNELADLARIYFEDGAPATAAMALRKLADELDVAQQKKNAELDALIRGSRR